jgi:hypothetical protein
MFLGRILYLIHVLSSAFTVFDVSVALLEKLIVV